MPITHKKTSPIPSLTQPQLDSAIAAGQYPAGTTLDDIVLSEDWNDTHDVDVDALNALIGSVLDLGDISGAITVDLSYSAIKFNLTGSATFTFINPPASGVNRPTTFYGTRTSGSNATLTLPSVAWATSTPAILDVYTTLFWVSTLNGGQSYFGAVNAISLENTVNGADTTWNPSDMHGRITLSNGNFTADYLTPSGILYYSVRAFGGKNSGKHRLTIRQDTNPSSSSSNVWGYSFGIASAGAALTPQFVGQMTPSMSLAFVAWTARTITKYKDNVATTTPTPIFAIGDTSSFIVDFDAGKLWFQRNGVFFTAGANPETGENPDYTFPPNGTVFFPMLSLARLNSTGGVPPTITLLTSTQDPWAFTTPSFQNWRN